MQYWRLIFKDLKEYAAKTRGKVYSGLLRDSTFIKKPHFPSHPTSESKVWQGYQKTASKTSRKYELYYRLMLGNAGVNS